jgi:hypothetical protein
MSLFDEMLRAAGTVAVLAALDITAAPRAADASEQGWVCGNQPGEPARCLEVVRPAGTAARVVRGGMCPRGELPFGGICYVLVIPRYAELDASGRAWSCRPGFRRSGAACLPEALPEANAGSASDAGLSGSAIPPGRTRDWVCRPGYYAEGAGCRPETIAAPPVPRPAAVPRPTGAAPAAPATIERVQRALAALGFDPGGVDGVLGERTREALRAYQARKGIPVTGGTSEDLISALDADFLHCAVWLPLARSAGTSKPEPCF